MNDYPPCPTSDEPNILRHPALELEQLAQEAMRCRNVSGVYVCRDGVLVPVVPPRPKEPRRGA